MKTFITTGAAALLFVPMIASAATVSGLAGEFLTFVDQYVVPLIFAIAFLVFIWGVFQYFIAGRGDAEKLQQGRSFVLWGIMGFVIMMCVWGLVNLVRSTAALDNSRPELPCFGEKCDTTRSSASSGNDTFVP